MGWKGPFVHGRIKHTYLISGECPSQMVLKMFSDGDPAHFLDCSDASLSFPADGIS